MLNININKGDIFWVVDQTRNRVVQYEYLCPFPFKGGGDSGYHLVIDRNTELPERMWKETLQQYLDKGLKTYEQANAELIKSLEDLIIYLKR